MSELPQTLFDYFKTKGSKHSYARGETIIHAGDVCKHVYMLSSGRVRFSLLSHQGREPILSEVDTGTVFGELAAIDGMPRAAMASAIHDTTLYRVSQGQFMEHLQNDWPSALWIMKNISGLLREQTEQTFRLSTLTSRSRLAHEILDLSKADDEAQTAVIDSFPTHSELAGRIGSHREAVTRELGALRKLGLLEQEGRTLRVLDMDGLRDLAAG